MADDSRPNLFEPDWESAQEQEGFRTRRASLGHQAGADRLGASLFEIEPGSAAFPLHYHLGNEEMLIVVAGKPALRDSDGERQLAEGDVVAFRVGEEGAHQVINRSQEPVRILMLSERVSPDIVVRPESGKISAFGRPPGVLCLGARMISGACASFSKLVCLHQAPCSPSFQPWSPHSTTMVLLASCSRSNSSSSFPTFASVKLAAA